MFVLAAGIAGLIAGFSLGKLFPAQARQLRQAGVREGYALGLTHFVAAARRKLRLETAMLGLGDIDDVERELRTLDAETRRRDVLP